MAHRIADDIVRKSLNAQSYFSTRAVTALLEGNAFRLMIFDHDGNNKQAALTSAAPILNPIISKSDQHVLCVSYENRKADSYLHEISTGRRKILKDHDVTSYCSKIESIGDGSSDRWTHFHWNSLPSGRCFQELLFILKNHAN